MKIKICGLCRPEDIVSANRARPDYVGFVFAESRRRADPDRAAAWRRHLSPGIRAVGVFVNESPEEVARCAALCRLDAVQLHGEEPEEDIGYLRKAAGLEVIRAVRIETGADVQRALASPADYLLFDSGAGMGRAFPWELLTGVRRPFFLAGGLCETNLEAACARVRPFCADLSSGAETDGVKDGGKMARLTRLAHSLPEYGE